MVYVVNQWNWVSYVVLMHVKFFDVTDCKFRFNLKNRVGMYLIWWEMGAKKRGSTLKRLRICCLVDFVEKWLEKIYDGSGWLIKFCSGLVTLMLRDFVCGSSRVNIIDNRDNASEVNLKNTRCNQWHNLTETLSIVREVLGEVALVPCKNIEVLNWILFVIMDNIKYLSKNNPTLTLF